MAVRLRQVALVARDLPVACESIRRELALDEPFVDPGVGEFGLTNAVFAVGDTFLEVVSPVREGTAAGRYLERRGGDGGYMAIFQVPDTGAARARVDRLGLRIVWRIDLDDISGTHLHPKDVPGAIVSFDTPSPAPSWRWAGPAWTGGAPDHRPGGILGVTVGVVEPAAAAARWAEVLGVEVDRSAAGTSLRIDGGGQDIRFVEATGVEGIEEVAMAMPPGARRERRAVVACGVRFRLVDG